MNPVSVIIPTYNGRSLLEKNLPSILASLRPGDEMIIVDDASTDDTLHWLKNEFSMLPQETSVPQTALYASVHKKIEIKALINQSNQRFAVSCNRGVSSAKHGIILLLNNDVIPEKDFLVQLLPHFEDENVFAVGCKEIATEEGNKVYGRSGGVFRRGFLVHYRESDQDQATTLWASGGSAAFRKSMWVGLGGFDPDYKPAYWEDIDLSWRAREKGWNVLFEPKSIVHHNHESTNASIFGSQQMEIMAYKNSFLFMWKNARGLELLKHFCWLPYHLFFTTIRSQGRFLIGLALACKNVLFS